MGQTASYLVYYARIMGIARNEADLFLLIEILLNSNNSHHAYMTLLWKDNGLVKKQLDSKSVNSQINYFELAKSFVKRFVKITNGKNVFFNKSLYGWLKLDLFDDGIRFKFINELVNENKNNTELQDCFAGFLMKTNKHSIKTKERYDLVFSKNEINVGLINTLIEDNNKEQLSELLFGNIQLANRIFAHLPLRNEQKNVFKITKAGMAGILFNHLVGQGNSIIPLYSDNDVQDLRDFCSLLRNILSHRDKLTENRALLYLVEIPNVHVSIKNILFTQFLDIENTKTLFLDYLEVNKKWSSLLKYVKFEKKLDLYISKAIDTLPDIGQDWEKVYERILQIAVSKEDYKILNNRIIHSLLELYIQKIQKYKRLNSGIFQFPVEALYQAHEYASEYFDHELFDELDTILMKEDTVYHIDSSTIRTLISLGKLSAEVSAAWLNKMEYIVKNPIWKVTNRYFSIYFKNWLILKNQFSFNQDDHIFILNDYNRKKDKEYLNEDMPEIIMLAECNSIKKELRKYVCDDLFSKKRYGSIILPFAISFYNVDNDPEYIIRFIDDANIKKEGYFEALHEDLAIEKNPHYFNRILRAGLALLPEWLEIAHLVLSLIRIDFTTGIVCNTVPAFTIKSLVLGLWDKDWEASFLVNELASIILPHAKSLLTHDQFFSQRENLYVIITFLLKHHLLNEEQRKISAKDIYSFLAHPDCHKSYPALKNYCLNQLNKNV